MKKNLLLTAGTIGLGLAVFIFGYLQATVLRGRGNITKRVQQELVQLADSALATSDVPIASILFYGDSIIGMGSNTVWRDTNAAGHAEINTISAALKHLGISQFFALNRDSLLLVSTYEPCAMCRGAILEYNIRRVEFLKDKPLFHLLREDARYIRYLWSRAQREPHTLQDSLFQLHPKYRP